MDTIQKVMGSRTVTVCASGLEGAPSVYANMHTAVCDDILACCSGLGCPDFNLVSVSGLDWNRDLSPWPEDSVLTDDDGFAGGADAYVGFLTDEVIPYAESIIGEGERIVAGYSMGGLFAVYVPFVTDLFSACVSASGSLWYPGFVDFMESHAFRKMPRSVYLSLGSREHRTPNPVMRAVKDCTVRIRDLCAARGVDAVFGINPGNHFMDAELRLARGIAWTLSR